MEVDKISAMDKNEPAGVDYTAELPIELITYLMEFLNYTDRKCAALVNRRWYEASLAPSFLNQDLVSIGRKDIVGESSITNNSRPFHHFKFSGVSFQKVDSSFEEFWTKMGPHIRTLRFSSCKMFRSYLSYILSSCPNLENLDISGCGDLFKIITEELSETSFRKTLPDLKVIKIHDDGLFTNALFDRLISMAPNLEVVSHEFSQMPDVLDSPNIEKPDIRDLLKSIDKRSMTINDFSFSCDTTSDDIGFMEFISSSCLTLKKFKFYHKNDWNNTFVLPLTEHQKNLTSIDLSYYIALSDETLKRICDTLLLLRELRISGSICITDLGISKLPKLIHLESLDISQCKELTPNGIVNALCQKENKILKWLNVGCIDELDDETVIKLSECLPNLTSLHIGVCKKAITDRSLQAICQRQIWLRVFGILFCDGITDTGLTGIPQEGSASHNDGDLASTGQDRQLSSEMCKMQRCSGETSIARLKGLRELYLQSTNITDLSLKFAFKFLELRKLYLEACLKITDEGYRFLGDQNPSLEDIHISGCENITEKGVVNLIRPLKRLKYLYLKDCKKLTAACSAALLEYCKSLKSCSIRGSDFIFFKNGNDFINVPMGATNESQ